MSPPNSMLSILLLVFLVHSRVLTAAQAKASLMARLKADSTEESDHCWESMFQLQSCTGEVITFFTNGETYLGPSCCEAIRTVSQQCWPDLLASLGYTNEEGDILEGYCEAEAHAPLTLEPDYVMAVTP